MRLAAPVFGTHQRTASPSHCPCVCPSFAAAKLKEYDINIKPGSTARPMTDAKGKHWMCFIPPALPDPERERRLAAAVSTEHACVCVCVIVCVHIPLMRALMYHLGGM